MTLVTLEREVLEAFRAGTTAWPEDGTPDAWTRWALGVTLEACRMIRDAQAAALHAPARMKSDRSPSTQVERDVETMVADRLAAFAPEARFVGEESGGTMGGSGVTVAVDPIDGTWAYLTGTETFAMTLVVLEDGAPTLGVVAGPVTGTVVYATPVRTRRLRLSVLGEPDAGATQPAVGSSGKVLVNCHPSRDARDAIGSLYRAWHADRVQVVRSPGGSPSWALVEAAAGAYVYVNLWSTRPAAPYDLLAGVLAVRSAGGEVIDLDGRPIDAMVHAGPFIAGVHEEPRAAVRDLLAARP